jgi:hypothetical protein
MDMSNIQYQCRNTDYWADDTLARRLTVHQLKYRPNHYNKKVDR